MGSILVVDDERSMREFLAICLRRGGHRVEAVAAAATGAQALDRRRRSSTSSSPISRCPDGDGLEVLDEVKQRAPTPQVIVVTAFATAETAIAAMKRGAYDYLTKPFKVDEIGAGGRARAREAGAGRARTSRCATRSRAATSSTR